MNQIPQSPPKKSLWHYITISYNGDKSVRPADIVRSKEGQSAILKDRKILSQSQIKD